MRIAIIGPFDIENYGDHLIREVLVHHIRMMQPNAKIDIFAISAGKLGFSQKEKVYSIDDLESHHKRRGYDALVLAGGSVVHFATLLQKVYGKQQPYHMWKLWSQASRVAAKYGVKLLWNSPEIPLELSGWEILVARQFFRAVDFLSVRDPYSYRCIQEIEKIKAHLSPDSAWDLRSIYSDVKIANSFPSELSRRDKLAIFHCNHRLAEQDKPKVIELLKKLQAKGYRVLLLPLAYTNSEEVTLRNLNTTAGDEFLFIERDLSIAEVVALFAHCRLYIGLSFHGAITTACFGGEVIAFDYEDRRKTKDIYASIGRLKHYTTSIDALQKVVEKYLIAKQKDNQKKKFAKSVQKLEQEVRKHFEKLSINLFSEKKKPQQNMDEFYEVALIETRKRFDTARQIQELSDGYQQCYTLYTNLLKETKRHV